MRLLTALIALLPSIGHAETHAAVAESASAFSYLGLKADSPLSAQFSTIACRLLRGVGHHRLLLPWRFAKALSVFNHSSPSSSPVFSLAFFGGGPPDFPPLSFCP